MITSKNILLDQALVGRNHKRLFPSVNPKSGVVTARDADATLGESDFNAISTNTGASAAIVLTLPSAILVGTKCLKVAVLEAFDITIATIDGEKIYLNGSGVEGAEVLVDGVVSNFVDIYSDGTDYLVTNYSGVLTKTDTVVSSSVSSSASSSASASLSPSSSASSSSSASLSPSSSASTSLSSSLSPSSSVSSSESSSLSASSSISDSASESLSVSSSISSSASSSISSSVSSSKSSSVSSSVSRSISSSASPSV